MFVQDSENALTELKILFSVNLLGAKSNQAFVGTSRHRSEGFHK